MALAFRGAARARVAPDRPDDREPHRQPPRPSARGPDRVLREHGRPADRPRRSPDVPRACPAHPRDRAPHTGASGRALREDSRGIGRAAGPLELPSLPSHARVPKPHRRFSRGRGTHHARTAGGNGSEVRPQPVHDSGGARDRRSAHVSPVDLLGADRGGLGTSPPRARRGGPERTRRAARERMVHHASGSAPGRRRVSAGSPRGRAGHRDGIRETHARATGSPRASVRRAHTLVCRAERPSELGRERARAHGGREGRACRPENGTWHSPHGSGPRRVEGGRRVSPHRADSARRAARVHAVGRECGGRALRRRRRSDVRLARARLAFGRVCVGSPRVLAVHVGDHRPPQGCLGVAGWARAIRSECSRPLSDGRRESAARDAVFRRDGSLVPAGMAGGRLRDAGGARTRTRTASACPGGGGVRLGQRNADALGGVGSRSAQAGPCVAGGGRAAPGGADGGTTRLQPVRSDRVHGGVHVVGQRERDATLPRSAISGDARVRSR